MIQRQGLPLGEAAIKRFALLAILLAIVIDRKVVSAPVVAARP